MRSHPVWFSMPSHVTQQALLEFSDIEMRVIQISRPNKLNIT